MSLRAETLERLALTSEQNIRVIAAYLDALERLAPSMQIDVGRERLLMASDPTERERAALAFAVGVLDAYARRL